MTGISQNVVANLLGRLWAALMSFAFVPFYIRLLGVEAYGLIGFFASIMAMFAVLDLGLGLTVNRELARTTASEGTLADARDLFRTLETVYWAVALAIGTGIVIAAPFLVRHWLNARTLDEAVLINAVRAMGVTALMRWPVSIYVGAMMGMQRQVRLNVVTSIAAAVASAGAVAILMFVSRTIIAFFLWQALIAACQVLVLRRMAWRSLDLADHRPRTSFSAFRATWGFSAAVMGITFLSVILTQLDKLVLSRMLSLDAFGGYALAAAIAGLLTTGGAAVESAAFPALSRLVAAGDHEGERRLYHQASQGLALLVVPLSVAMALFSRELLTAYVSDPAITRGSYRVMSLLVAGNGVLALMFMPLSLQLAHGWTRLSLVKNVIAVVLFVPLLWLLAAHFGAIGAASAWLLLTMGYLLLEVPVMHRRLLRGEQRRWYLTDVGIPVVISFAVLGTLRMVLPVSLPMIVQIVAIATAGIVSVLAAAAALPSSRHYAMAVMAGRSPVQA